MLSTRTHYCHIEKFTYVYKALSATTFIKRIRTQNPNNGSGYTKSKQHTISQSKIRVDYTKYHHTIRHTMKIIETLKRSLEVSISNCKEAYIAVALINEYGYEILCKAKISSKIKIVAGIDLPTSVDVLTKLKRNIQSI